jgi:hypothetical protein
VCREQVGMVIEPPKSKPSRHGTKWTDPNHPESVLSDKAIDRIREEVDRYADAHVLFIIAQMIGGTVVHIEGGGQP